MPRPVKCRKVCYFPNVLEFFPADDTEKKTPIVLTVDEYETIRLLDKKGYYNGIYELARKKKQMRSLMDIRLESRAGISESATVRVAAAALEDVTNRRFTKNMQWKKERV